MVSDISCLSECFDKLFTVDQRNMLIPESSRLHISILIEYDVFFKLLSTDSIGLTTLAVYFDRFELLQLEIIRKQFGLSDIAVYHPTAFFIHELLEDLSPIINGRLD